MAAGYVGRVTDVDLKKRYVKVDCVVLKTDWIPLSTPLAGSKAHLTFSPAVGDRCAVLRMHGAADDFVYLGSVPEDDLPELENENDLVIDLKGGTLKLDGNVKITGNIEVIGNISVDGNIAASGDIKAGGISLTSHTHGGVESGGSNTGGPQ